MNLDDFEDIVNETLKDIPENFSKAIENVGVVVEGWPGWEDFQAASIHPNSLLFGLYRGIPNTQRTSNYSALPDKIIIFAGPILMVSKSIEEAKSRIKKTVLHEIGHYFGLSDAQIYKAQGF